uniref:Uncharacterized protein n=1 Tax=Aegilops tauschii subsp. strangulata TaxID=200361 RepID=A0A453T7C2_AEGTS
GPWRLPVIGSIHHLIGALPHHAMRDLARRYDAPLMLLRLGELNVVVASSAIASREILASGFSLADLFPSSRLARAFSSSIRRMEALNNQISQLIGRIIEEHRMRRSAGGGDEEEDIVDVLLRIQNDGSLHMPLNARTIGSVIMHMFHVVLAHMICFQEGAKPRLQHSNG